MRSKARADIHDGQEPQRKAPFTGFHGPDTEAQDQSSPSVTFGLQHTAGPYSWVISGNDASAIECPLIPRTQTSIDVCRPRAMRRHRAPSSSHIGNRVLSSESCRLDVPKSCVSDGSIHTVGKYSD